MVVVFFFGVFFRVPVPVSGSGQFKLRRQGSELLLDGALSPPCQRMGAMVAFQCFDDFKRSFLFYFYFFLDLMNYLKVKLIKC